MKLRAFFLLMTLGMTAGLFACQDQGVVAPDDAASPDDLVAAFGKPTCDNGGTWPKCEGDDPPTTGDPTLALSGALDGLSSTDVTWKSKKGIFSMHAPFAPLISYTGGLANCATQGDQGQRLVDAFAIIDGGKVANIYVDEEMVGFESPIHRIFVLVEGEIVRYFWIGPRYTVGETDFDHDGTFTDVSVQGGPIQYEMTGGVIGVRDTEGPSSHTQIACEYSGSITVTLTK